jgi:hypothetical protein
MLGDAVSAASFSEDLRVHQWPTTTIVATESHEMRPVDVFGPKAGPQAMPASDGTTGIDC